MPKIRIISGLIIICAVIVFVLTSDLKTNAFVRACLNAKDLPNVVSECHAALALDDISDEERGLALFALGYAHHQQDPEQAINYYSQAIVVLPTKTSAFFNRGKLRASGRRDNPGAIEDFSVVIERANSGDRRYDDVYEALVMRARTYRRLDQYDLAKADLDQAFILDPTNRLAVREGFSLASNTKSYEQLRGAVDAALAVEPDDPWLWLQSSRVHSRSDDDEAALADVEKAIALGANNAGTWHQRGWLRRDAGDFQGALSDLDKALALSPDYGPAQDSKSNLLSEVLRIFEDDPDEVIAFASTGLQRNPDDVGLLHLRGAAYGSKSLGDLPAAMRDINRAIQLQDSPHRSLLIRSSVYARFGQMDAAFADLNRVINDSRLNSPALKQLREEYAQVAAEEDQNKADEILDQIDRLLGLHDNALRARSNLNRQIGNIEAALKDHNEIITADPDDTRHLMHRADFLAEMGRRDEAIADYNRAMLLIDTGEADLFYPPNELPVQILLKRGKLHQASGNASAALADFETALAYDNPEVTTGFKKIMREAGHYDGPINNQADDATSAALAECAADPSCG